MTVRVPAENLVGGYRRADELLDVFDEEFGAAIVIHIGPALRVVHGVGEIPDEHCLSPVLHHLPQAERTAGHAFVHVHAHEDHMPDAACFE